ILNELSIHGRDIARATKAQWTIPPQDAAMFFEHFVVGMVRLDHGRLLETPEPSEERVSVHFRSEYLDPVTLVLDRGRVTAEPSDDVDVRITFDPTTFNLMMFGRISPPRAMLTGKVSVAGRRPWRLPIFLKTVRMPS
ncbi:MAG TPA: SCP2 sterol-binding domain-containing protein, partial [Micromonosporaceae bacterium]